MTSPSTFQELLRSGRIAVLNDSPPVLTAYDSDFAKGIPALAEFCRQNPRTSILVQLGFEHETDAAAERLSGAVAQFREASGDAARVIVLCNCENECAALGKRGCETRFIHQNCFLDERRYRPMPGKRIYDAVYIARVTGFKRHTLIPAELAPRLLLLGAFSYDFEREYADLVHQRYAAAHWVRRFSGARISEHLACAKCGLALSASEGACFASSEYLLCGLPVVDTPALGGRSVLYPPEFVRSVEATPEAIGEGVAYWVANPPDPQEVRTAWLQKAQPHRQAYEELMRELTGGRGIPRFPHRLGLRTPHGCGLYSRAIQLYLAMKGLWMRVRP